MSIIFKHLKIEEDGYEVMKETLLNYYKNLEERYSLKLDNLKRMPFMTIKGLHLLIYKQLPFNYNNIRDYNILKLYQNVYDRLIQSCRVTQATLLKDTKNYTLPSIISSLIDIDPYGSYDPRKRHFYILDELSTLLDNMEYPKSMNLKWINHVFDTYSTVGEISYYYPIANYIVSRYIEHFVRYYVYNNIVFTSNDTIRKQMDGKYTPQEIRRLAIEAAERCKKYIKTQCLTDLENDIDKTQRSKIICQTIDKIYSVSGYLEYTLDGLLSDPGNIRYFDIIIEYDTSNINVVIDENGYNLQADIKIDFK